MVISAARSGALFLHGAACTIHKAQGSQWPEVQVFASDISAAAWSGNEEAGIQLWKRLAYVAITRAEERLHWVTRAAISKPEEPLGARPIRSCELPAACPRRESLRVAVSPLAPRLRQAKVRGPRPAQGRR